MANIKCDFEKQLGRIKPMHGVGQPPMVGGFSFPYFKYLKDANIPYSRLHDVGGFWGGSRYVDIPNIFRDFDADENDEAAYDFTYTDLLIEGLMKNDCEPVFRLGVSIENNPDIKVYRIFPPKDMPKWARICEHIIRHYNEGWANGYHYNIKYWEIWNEPDNGRNNLENMMWQGTKEEYYELYRVTSKHLRSCFGDSIKIGGYASSGFYAVDGVEDMEKAVFIGLNENTNPTNWELRTQYFVTFFEEFIDMVSKEKLPFDFFSHHSYASVQATLRRQDFVERKLEKTGLGDVEIHLNEWAPNPRNDEKGTSLASANVAAMMCAMQNTKMEMMCYYDAKIGIGDYAGMFNPLTYKPFCTYYSFMAFGNLYRMGTQAEAVCDNDKVYVVAATDGTKKGMMLTNLGEDTTISINIDNVSSAYLIDQDNMYTPVSIDASSFSLKQNQTMYIEA